MGAGVEGMQMRARQAGKPALRISEALLFRQGVVNSLGHPQDSRMATEVVAPGCLPSMRWRQQGAGEPGEALRGGQGAGMFSET